MPSCIIDLTGSNIRTHITAPLFYPLVENGEVRFLNGSMTNLSALFEDIRVMLLHGPAVAPRFIFLLSLVENPDRKQFFKHSLASRFSAIRSAIIEPVLDLGYALEKSYAVVLDSVRRVDATGSPIGEFARKTWELDINGLNEESTEIPFLFSRKELQELDEAWGAPSSLTGCRLDDGINGLSTPLVEEMRRRIDHFRESFAALMRVKNEALSAFIADGNSAAPYLSLNVLDAIESDVLKRFNNLIQDLNIGPLINLYPSELLALAIAEQLSIAAHAERFQILAWSLAENPPQARSRSLIALDYLLLLLCTHAAELSEQLTEAAYAASLDLDSEALAAALADYDSCLLQSAKALETEAGNNRPISLEVYDDSACSSKVVLPPAEAPSGTHFPLFYSGSDRGTWDVFLKTTGNRLDDFSGMVADKIEECAQDLRLRGKRRTTEAVQDIEGKIREFQQNFDKRRKEVAAGAVPPYTLDWQGSVEKETREYVEISERRPTFRIATLTVLTTALCFGAGFGSGVTLPAGGGEPALYAVPTFCLAASLVVTITFIFLYRARLHRLVRRIFSNAGESLKRLENNFNNARNFLSSLCALDASRRNLEGAIAEQRSLSERRLKIRYHIDRLKAHRDNAIKFGDVLGLGPHPHESAPTKECHPDCDKPVPASSIYRLSQAASQRSIEIEVGSKRCHIESDIFLGLSKARFSYKDAICCGVLRNSSGGRHPEGRHP